MKKLMLLSLMLGVLPLTMMAQDDDDMYFVPTKKAMEKQKSTYALPQNTYYVGSNRSIDDYNRRIPPMAVPTDTALCDTIDFDGQMGVYPDSLQDFQLTREMSRWDGYEPKDSYWDGYADGRHDAMLNWHSPWFYDYYGMWWDPWMMDRYYLYHGLWGDPWFYSGWYNPWYYGYYGYGYYPGYYPYYYGYGWYPSYWGGGGGSHRHYNDRAGTINMRSGNMNGRVYSSANAGRARNGNTTRLGAQRTTSLRNRTVANHSAYTPSATSRITNTSSTTTYPPSTNSNSIGGSGFSSGGGRVSSSGGGGARSVGGHVGGRR